MKKQDLSIRLTRAETSRILSTSIYKDAREHCMKNHSELIELMCKEYGQSFETDDNEWTGIYPEDYVDWEEDCETAKDGLVIPDEYQTFELWTLSEECADTLYEFLKKELKHQ